MLGPGRYLLGVAELLLLLGCAGLGAWRVRRWLVPELGGVVGGLATSVIAAALLIWCAELLGSFGAWEAVPYLGLVAVVGLGAWWLAPRAGAGGGDERARDEGRGEALGATLIALAIAAIAVIHFGFGVKAKLSTGMTGFDSTWYHGPFAAGFFQEGDTWRLHLIAPQFLAWFYPANAEIFHAAGMLAFSRDLLSPLLNLGWFLGCLVACWCIGRPYRVGAWSLALGAVALSVPALHDQAGEARNDIAGIFFLLAAVAVAVNAWTAARDGQGAGGEEGPEGGAEPDDPRRAERGLSVGALAVVGLAAGLAAGTKLNFLLPAAVLVVGLAAVAPKRARWRALWVPGVAALAGGGYWYLRNLAHSGNPLPWIHHLGPITLPAPEQALGGREAHTVLSYLTDGTVWSDWFLPGLHAGLWIVWPLLGAAALAGLVLALLKPRDRLLAVAGVVGLAAALAWLVAPTSASGPEGMPRGFESGLRYLAPALVLGLALLPAAPRLRAWPASRPALLSLLADRPRNLNSAGRRQIAAGVVALAVLVVAVGYPVQRHYLGDRYANPTFAAPGLNAAFKWARDSSGARIATTSTRQYPLFGTDLSNHVQFVGVERPHGGFEAPSTCPAWRRALNRGGYDYVVTSRDRLEPGKPPYPATARWTESPQTEVVLRKPPTVVFKLKGRLSPSACPPD